MKRNLRQPRKINQCSQRRNTRRALHIEGLENRNLFAGLTVTGASLIIDGDTSSISSLQAKPGSDGLISLPEAVAAANNTMGTDHIAFAASLDGVKINAKQLTITDDLTIRGNGRDKTELNGGSGGTSIFTVQKGAAFSVADATIKQGKAQKGGAIENLGTTTLSNMLLTGNRADDAGGAIYNRQDATLLVVDSTLEFNATLRSTTGFYKGGAIYNAFGDVVIVKSTIRNNASGRGGGVFSESLYKSDGSVSKTGSVTIRESIFEHNSAGDDGGGLFNFGQATVLGSLFVNNSAPNSSGGAIANTARLTLNNSTLTANDADHGDGLISGSILAGVDVLSIVQNSTIVGNDGHGIYQTTGTVALSNTILHGNDRADYRLSSAFGTLRSEGYNLIGTTENPVGGNVLLHATDLTDVDPLLGALADNGGPTMTFMPLPDSPVIDAGDPSFDGATYDQRDAGFARVQNGRVDIGAVEAAAEPRDVVGLTMVAVDSQGNILANVDVGHEFYIQVYAEDLRDNSQGVFSAYVDLLYNPELVGIAGATEFPGVYQNARSSVNTTPGSLDEVGAFSIQQSPVGSERQILLGIPFVATRAGTADFMLNPADQLPEHPLLLYGRNAFVTEDEIHFGSLRVTVNEAPTACVSWQNCGNPFDVNDDGIVSPLDALIPINRLNDFSAGQLPEPGSDDFSPSAFYDVSGDGYLAPNDVLMVINHLNSAANVGEAEGLVLPNATRRFISDTSLFEDTFLPPDLHDADQDSTSPESSDALATTSMNRYARNTDRALAELNDERELQRLGRDVGDPLLNILLS